MMPSERTDTDSRGSLKRPLDVCIAHPASLASIEDGLTHLLPHLAELESDAVHVTIVVDGPAPEGTSQMLERIGSTARHPIRVRQQAHPLGRARSLNEALHAAAAAGHDLLLLSPATRLGTGSLRELLAVAGLHLRAGFVAPRSTLGRFGALLRTPTDPVTAEPTAATSLEVVARNLPRATAVPLLDAHCLFVRHAVLADLRGLSEAFGVSFHHEYEWILRAADSGWLALLANHAAISVADDGTTACSEDLHAPSIANLTRIHSGLQDALARSDTAGARAAEEVLAGLLPDADGCLRVAIDIAHMRPVTELDCRRLFDALSALARRTARRMRLVVLCEAAEFRRLGLDRIAGLGRRQIASAGSFAVALEFIGRTRPVAAPGLEMLAPVLVPVFLADEPVDRLVLRGGWREHESLRRRLQLVNGFMVHSGEDVAALRAVLDLGNDPPVLAHPGSTLLADHLMTLDPAEPSHLLCVDDAADLATMPPLVASLAASKGALPVVVAGRGERKDARAQVVDWQQCGPARRRHLLSAAAAVVITTHRTAPTSWIGMALASRKPLVLRDSPGNRAQLALFGGAAAVHWFAGADMLDEAVRAALADHSPPAPGEPGPDWDSWADTLIRYLLELVARPDLYKRTLRRVDTLSAGRSTVASPIEPTQVMAPLPDDPVEQMLALDDASFLSKAYDLLLNREVDPLGGSMYREMLARGCARADVLLSLCMSDEAIALGRRPPELDRHLGEHLSRLVSLQGRDFVERAFNTILLRAPDDPGLEHFANLVESGRSRLDILLDLARSDEGRARGARPSLVSSLLRKSGAAARQSRRASS